MDEENKKSKKNKKIIETLVNEEKKEQLNDNVKKKKSNKMIYIILALIFVIVLFVYLFTGDKPVISTGLRSLSDEEALSIGTEKYLDFLWMVDSAFNDSRYEGRIKVNNQEIDETKTLFSCKYDKDKEWCKGENFEEAFRNVFASDITYNDVYGDGLAVYWYEKRGDGYFFQNSIGCNIKRMSLDQTLELTKKERNQLTFKVSYVDNITAGAFEGEHQKIRDFVLIKEDGEWKVSKAYYHDLCFQDYPIPRNYN